MTAIDTFLVSLRYVNIGLIVVAVVLCLINTWVLFKHKGPTTARLVNLLFVFWLVRDLAAILNFIGLKYPPSFSTYVSTLGYLFTILISVFFLTRGFDKRDNRVL